MRIRKIIYISLLAIFMLTACGKQDKKEPVQSEKEESQKQNKEDSLNKVLFFTLFTTSCCTLFTTVFEIVTAVSAHYSIPIMHIKYSYQETKHII